MTFPDNYPVSPPTVRFTSEMWHPNGVHLSSTIKSLNYVWFCFKLCKLLIGCHLNYSLPWWKGLHFNSSSPGWWSKWLRACNWTLDSSTYGIVIELPWFLLPLLCFALLCSSFISYACHFGYIAYIFPPDVCLNLFVDIHMVWDCLYS